MKGLLFITHQTEKYTYLDSVQIALEGGCRRIQLRMKHATAEEVEAVAHAARQLCEKHRAELYIDDHVEVCKRVRATGVHLGKSDMPPQEARNLLGPACIIGGTANTFDDVVRLHAAGVDYIGLGPFRFTTTKKNLSPVLGLEGYRSILDRCRERGITLPVLAIGGITVSDIPAILNTGVSGIALSSAILQASDPVGETKRIAALLNDALL